MTAAQQPRWQTADGRHTVQVISLASGQYPGEEGQWFIIRERGCFTGRCRTVAELAGFVDIASLEETR